MKKLFKELWHSILVHFGIRPCCDKRKMVERSSSPSYWEYECLNCGFIKAGASFINL